MYSKHSHVIDQLAFQTVPRPCQVYSPVFLRRAVYSKHSPYRPTRLAGGSRTLPGLLSMVVMAGVEPATFWFRARCSSQLRYITEQVSRIELPSPAWQAGALAIVLYLHIDARSKPFMTIFPELPRNRCHSVRLVGKTGLEPTCS